MRADVQHARRALRWRDSGGPEEVDDIRTVIDGRREGASKDVGWVNIRQDEMDRFSELAPRLHLDDEALEDLAARRERPKLDVESGVLTPHPVSAVVGDGVLITVINNDDFLTEFAKRVKRERSTVTAGHLLY